MAGVGWFTVSEDIRSEVPARVAWRPYMAKNQAPQEKKEKGQAGCPGCPWGDTKDLLGDRGLAETVAEFLHAATHIVNRLLCACVEGV